ncbi:hypothetical protein GOV13_01885 [Candidatus Pacearchaeota archaeon]|nr:hypothetical protein [Candidatus Pacearchaeota archaeon]
MKRYFIFVGVVLGVLMLSLVSAGLFTGNVIWDWKWCSQSTPCPSGEGDCDKPSDCLTGYCSKNVGVKYKKSKHMDVCECRSGESWDNVISTCVGSSTSNGTSGSTENSSGTDSGSGGMPINGSIDYQSILNMLNQCHVNSMLTLKQTDPNFDGNVHCGSSYTCIGSFFSEVPNPTNAYYDLRNSLRSSCTSKYGGLGDAYYMQTICCSPPSN